MGDRWWRMPKVGVVGGMTLLFLLACRGSGPSPDPAPQTSAEPVVSTLQERFGAWPFLELIDSPDAIDIAGQSMKVRAANCGSCHTDVYREWQGSTHANAINDLQYLAELSKGSSPRWLCLNCHIPLADQRAYRVTLDTEIIDRGEYDIGGLVKQPNPDFRPELVQEAITCATCHVRADAQGDAYIVGPRGAEGAPHAVQQNREALHDICERCHSPGTMSLTPLFFCWFETGTEAGGQDCAGCHMPEVERPVAVGAQPRITRSHQWLGGGVPKSYEAYERLSALGWKPGVATEIGEVRPGEQGPVLPITLSTADSAHDVPTADPERHLLVKVTLLRGGESLSEHRTRLGQTWDWGDEGTGRPAKRIADRRLVAGSPVELLIPVPRWADADQLRVEVLHVKLSTSNLEHMAKVELPAEVSALAPGFSKRLPEMAKHYPIASYVYRGSRTLPDGEWEVDTVDQLIAASVAAQGFDAAQRADWVRSNEGSPPPRRIDLP